MFLPQLSPHPCFVLVQTLVKREGWMLGGECSVLSYCDVVCATMVEAEQDVLLFLKQNPFGSVTFEQKQ